MYKHFYGLTENPFNITADPSFFYLSRKHQEALSHLYYGIIQRSGIMVVTGEIGTGKTTLCRYFLNRLDTKTKTAFLMNPFFPDIQLWEAIMTDFGIKPKNDKQVSFYEEFNKFLLKEAAAGNNVVLIIDEAQNLELRQLEQVRLLTNLETEKEKLLQIILVGQPELNRKLASYDLRQLRQRISLRCHLSTLTEHEIGEYIYHRLHRCCASHKITFSEDALCAIKNFSKGIPRLINILCDRALLAGFVRETFLINSEIVALCIEELENCYTGELL